MPILKCLVGEENGAFHVRSDFSEDSVFKLPELKNNSDKEIKKECKA